MAIWGGYYGWLPFTLFIMVHYGQLEKLQYVFGTQNCEQ